MSSEWFPYEPIQPFNSNAHFYISLIIIHRDKNWEYEVKISPSQTVGVYVCRVSRSHCCELTED
jgi:hypothetical protein